MFSAVFLARLEACADRLEACADRREACADRREACADRLAACADRREGLRGRESLCSRDLTNWLSLQCAVPLVLADLTGFEKIEVFDDCDQLIDFAFVVEEVHRHSDPAMSDSGQHSVVV